MVADGDVLAILTIALHSESIKYKTTIVKINDDMILGLDNMHM